MGEHLINYHEVNLHLQKFRFEIGGKVLNKQRIYLDTKYWIYLRDAMISGKPSTRLEIYNSLSNLVKNEVAICPLSYHLFLELMRQPYEKRIASARMMDELSNQICFIHPQAIAGQELINLLSRFRFLKDGLSMFDSSKYVWSKIALVIVQQYPTLPLLSENIQKIVQIGFFDHLKDFTLLQIIERIGDKLLPERSTGIIEKLNTGKDIHQNWRTFHDVYMQEVRGILEILQPDINEVLFFLDSKERPHPLERDDNEKSEEVIIISNLIYKMFENDTIGKELPNIRIGCGLHSYFRYNKTQKFKQNDLLDFNHATWALPYCDAFFTERRLNNWVCNKFLQFDSVYGTKVLSDEKSILKYLNKLDNNIVD